MRRQRPRLKWLISRKWPRSPLRNQCQRLKLRLKRSPSSLAAQNKRHPASKCQLISFLTAASARLELWGGSSVSSVAEGLTEVRKAPAVASVVSLVLESALVHMATPLSTQAAKGMAATVLVTVTLALVLAQTAATMDRKIILAAVETPNTPAVATA